MKLALPPRVHEARVAFSCMSWPVSRDSVTEWVLLLLLLLFLLLFYSLLVCAGVTVVGKRRRANRHVSGLPST